VVTIRAIRITGEPVLHAVADPVQKFDENLQELVVDMVDTMRAAPGVGLAAPQIGVALQVFVYEWHDGETQFSGVAVNPTLELSAVEVRTPDEDEEVEGCLSVPGERMPLVRAEAATLRAQDEFGKPYELVATGWLARIFQHEYDHLQGVLYVDRLLPEYREEIDLAIADEGWGVPGKSWLPGTDSLEG
jgi:peptide deformylase